MLYLDQPLKGAFIVTQAIAIPFVYAPYWALTSIPYFFTPLPEGGPPTRAATRYIRISFLRQMMSVFQK